MQQCRVICDAVRNALTPAALCLLLLLVPGVRASEAPSEFLLTQYPGIDLLIRISAIDTSFESRVYDPDEKLVKASRVRHSRLGPVYQLIEAVETTRLLRVEVTPESGSYQSDINIEMIQLKRGGPESGLLGQAYSYLSVGTQSVEFGNASTWAMKASMLQRAAGAFEQLGMEEMRLWSEYYVAHVVYYELGDRLTAIEFAREVQDSAKKAGIGLIELAALQLEGAALIDTQQTTTLRSDAAMYELAQLVFERAAAMAAAYQRPVEQGWAIFNSGIAFEQQQELPLALEQYQRALDIAMKAGDTGLANEIRHHAADAYESQGSNAGAIEMLDQMNVQLAEQSETREQAQILLEKGRILISAFRFDEAAEALSEAVDLEQNLPTPNLAGPAGLALGQAYYSMGHLDLAESVLEESIVKTQASSHALSLAEAHRTLAGIYRQQGRLDQMRAARAEQESFISSESERAYFLFEQALDSVKSNGAGTAASSALFRESGQLAAGLGLIELKQRSYLHLCVTASADCNEQTLKRSYAALLADGIPRHAQEARFLWSRILRARGQTGQLIGVMDQLIDDIEFFRSVLPGVLGAWYWEHREEIFSGYMSLMLRQAGSGSGGFTVGKRSLFALDRLRAIESRASRQEWDNSAQFRSLLARRGLSLPGNADPALVQEINSLLRAGRDIFEQRTRPGSRLGQLLESLDDEHAVLVYYFSGNRVHAWVGRNDGIRLLSLTGGANILSAMAGARSGLASAGNPVPISELDALGRLLVEPLSPLLPENISLIPSGPLSGFPFDAIRLDGQYLVQRHFFVNRFSLGALTHSDVRTGDDTPVKFFLAGNPELERDYFSYEQKTSPEIRSVADIFVGPGLHIVQGVALRKDEFDIEKFLQADRIHLSIPGTIDLRFPERSQLVLSGSAGPFPAETVQPADIRQLAFSADVAVLSASAMTGSGNSAFDSQLGFVSGFLGAGVRSVIASQWQVEEKFTARFMADFYRNLNSIKNVGVALTVTKRQAFEDKADPDVHHWAAFQLYLE